MAKQTKSEPKAEPKITARSFANSRTDFSVFDKALFNSFRYKPTDLRTQTEWVREAVKEGVLKANGRKK